MVSTEVAYINDEPGAGQQCRRYFSQAMPRRLAQQQKHANQAAAQQEAAAEQAAPAAAPQDDLATQLESLAKLRDQGILTEEEFSAKKAQILGI